MAGELLLLRQMGRACREHGSGPCVEFFLEGGAVLVPATVPSLRRVRELLDEYTDLPMDYADATLVVLAEEIGPDLVFTTSRLYLPSTFLGSSASRNPSPM